MDDLISRQAVIDEVKALRPYALVLDDGCELYANYDIEYVISHLPSVPERKKGKWEWNINDGFYYCSECEAISPREDQNGEYCDCPNFCPHCGADMRGER